MWYIYLCVNKINGKMYIGQTRQSFKKRKNRHLYDALKLKDNVCFHRAIRKYGKENFIWSILQSVPNNCENLLNEAEIFWIEYFNTQVPNGYNTTSGGTTGYNFKQTKEAIDKIRNAKIGSKATEQTKRILSKAHTGVKLSQAHIEANARGHYKKVRCIELNIVFESVKAAGQYCLDNNLTTNKSCASAITSCLKGRTETAYGFHWEYVTT